MFGKLLYPLFLCVLFIAAGILQPQKSWAESYQITSEQLTALTQQTQRLKTLSEQLKIELTNSQDKCRILAIELTEAQLSLTVSTQTLTELQTSLKESQTALKQSQELLNQYKKQTAAQITSLEMQRNIAIIAGIGLTILAIIFI